MKKKNGINGFLKGLISVVIFPFWIIVHPLMMLLASCFQGIANKSWYSKSANYGNKVKNHFLIGKRSSRLSFTFAHALLHFLFFLISFLLLSVFYNSYINKSTAVKNKNLNIEVTDNTPAGHVNIDSTTSNQLAHFGLTWDNEDSVKMKKIDPLYGFPLKHMYFEFMPKTHEKDTTFFKITIHADYNLKIDTAEIRRGLKQDLADHVFNYEIEKFGENEGKYFIVINLNVLPLCDDIGEDTIQTRMFRLFNLPANPEMYDDDDPPYLNYFIHFSFARNSLDSLVLKPSETRSNSQLTFSFWDSYTFAKDTDLGNVSNYPYYNVPYELLDVIPKPDTNHPYILIYNGESFREAIQRGVYLKFVNRDLLQKNDKRVLFWTVVFGALASFILTIIIDLFTKWRNVNLRSGNKDPYNEE